MAEFLPSLTYISSSPQGAHPLMLLAVLSNSFPHIVTFAPKQPISLLSLYLNS